MGKRLRKRIRELCGIDNLGREEKHKRAREIIDDYEFKQSICLKAPGITHLDIERTMKVVLAERKVETEEQALRRIAPQKFESQQEYKIKKTKKFTYKCYTREEVRKLIERSKQPLEQKPAKPIDYSKISSWFPEEVAALIDGMYHPKKFKYLRKKKKGKI